MWLETRSIDGGRILKVYRDVGFNEGGLKTILSGRSKMGKWRIFGIKILLGGGEALVTKYPRKIVSLGRWVGGGKGHGFGGWHAKGSGLNGRNLW